MDESKTERLLRRAALSREEIAAEERYEAAREAELRRERREAAERERRALEARRQRSPTVAAFISLVEGRVAPERLSPQSLGEMLSPRRGWFIGELVSCFYYDDKTGSSSSKRERLYVRTDGAIGSMDGRDRWTESVLEEADLEARLARFLARHGIDGNGSVADAGA